jgi:hypothetical protein
MPEQLAVVIFVRPYHSQASSGGHAARLRVVCGHSNDELRYRATSPADLHRQPNRPRREPAATPLRV